jgi:3-oxoacyl-[acyl-carrier-protein] synthase II
MDGRRCEIVGLGAVTGYGWGRESLWRGLRSGISAARPVPGYGERRDEPGWVALVADRGRPEDGPTRFAQAMRAAAREAIEDAGRRGWRPGRVGLVHAVVLGEVDLWRDFYLAHSASLPLRDYLYLMPSTPVSLLMQEFGFQGPALHVSAMCASGNAGLLTAKAWLDAGIVDDVVVVSTDLSASPEHVLHFTRLGVAITDIEPLDACRPFQEGSRGFIMGEGSAAFVLSNGHSSGEPYLSALGGAMTHDGHHVTSIDPSLDAVRACVAGALADAGVPGSAVRYLHAHGPGTKQCDRAESAVLTEFFPPEARVYSVKPLVSHCQGAASAVEIVATALAYQHGVIPAPAAVAPGHPQLLSGPTAVADGLTVKTSLGMGGHNSAVVLAPAS